MPSGRFNQRNVPTNYRRCPQCGDIFPATPDYFYARSNGRLELCTVGVGGGCRGAYFRSYSAARRSTGTNRKFGIEVEFIGDGHAVARAMTAAGLPCDVEGYNHTVRTHWKIVPDSSVYGGMELVSPPLRGADGRRQVETAMKAARSACATVNNSCGLHVHHDVGNLSREQFVRLYRFWYTATDAIDGLVARSRRDGQWSHHIDREDIASVEGMNGIDREFIHRYFGYDRRYRTLNLDAFSKYGTVEVRLHQGTTDYRKILAWVEFGQATITYASDTALSVHSPVSGTAILLAMLESDGGLSSETRTYLQSRADMFASSGRVPDAMQGADADDIAAESDEEGTEYYIDDDDDYCTCSACTEERELAYA